MNNTACMVLRMATFTAKDVNRLELYLDWIAYYAIILAEFPPKFIWIGGVDCMTPCL